MAITVEAVYENGVLKPAHPLPLEENARVQITIESPRSPLSATDGVIGCTDTHLIEWAAMDPELDYPTPLETWTSIGSPA